MELVTILYIILSAFFLAIGRGKYVSLVSSVSSSSGCRLVCLVSVHLTVFQTSLQSGSDFLAIKVVVANRGYEENECGHEGNGKEELDRE